MDFLNGAINQIDVKSIGTSLSGLALGILTTLDNALTTTNWSQLGTKLATLLTSIDWVGIFVSAISVAGKSNHGINTAWCVFLWITWQKVLQMGHSSLLVRDYQH